MIEFQVNDLAVITGPVTFFDGSCRPTLVSGEVVSVLEPIDQDGDYYVLGHESDNQHWISGDSLTPLSQIQQDDTTEWGDPADAVDYSGIHDYVWEGHSE